MTCATIFIFVAAISQRTCERQTFKIVAHSKATGCVEGGVVTFWGGIEDTNALTHQHTYETNTDVFDNTNT